MIFLPSTPTIFLSEPKVAKFKANNIGTPDKGEAIPLKSDKKPSYFIALIACFVILIYSLFFYSYITTLIVSKGCPIITERAPPIN